MSDPFFSIIVCTARVDHPFTYHRDWHVLDKIVENCQKQTFKDFELILVDLLYFHRSDYFKNKDFGFKLLHIPDKKSIFRELKLPRISSSKNTGIIFSRGQHLVFSDDGQEWPEHAFESLSKIAKQGMGASCKYFVDEGSGPVESDSRWVAYGMAGTKKSKRVLASSMGFFGGTLSMVSRDAMLICNGWDEMFDGSRQLEDGDMAQRLGAYRCFVTLNGEVDVIEHKMDLWCSDARIFLPNVFLKCNGAYLYPIMFGSGKKRFTANERSITDHNLLSYTYGKCKMIARDERCSVSKDSCLGEKWHWTANPDDAKAVAEGRPEGIDFLKRVYQDSRLVFNLAAVRKFVAESADAARLLLFEP